ncbi:recombinase family protein [archaeon]|jgi:site-specific DNA recombinase|nr:recombinase family protein [archaeon]MBT6755725.1 recombinase family protein [Candidatus Paceibacterota bacterium]MBT6921166.1 recombinase family protein [Candidatus Paceibacterota bacterium]
MKNLVYCLYSRKSSESKERQALSIQDQKAECVEYAQREKIFIDEDLELSESKSAFKPNNRPVFTQMLHLIESGRINAILTWKPDRLSRNPEEGGRILQMLQDGRLKAIHTATGEVYTQDSDHLILQIHFGMANQYSRNLSQNVKRGMKRKCLRKEYPGTAPVGYMSKGEPGRKNIVPHPVEAPVLKELFQLASQKVYSLGYLEKWLYEKKIRTKRGKRISKSHLVHILTTPTYYGYFTYGEELYEGSYEPLVSKTIWNRIQKALRDRSKAKINTWKPYLNGIIKCGQCGCSITTTVKKKYYKRTDRTAEYRYNHCTHRRGDCDQPQMTVQELEEQLASAIGQIKISEDVWKLGIKLLKAKNSEETDRFSEKLKILNSQLERVQERKKRLIVMRADEEIYKDEFIEQKALILNEEARINSLINDLSDSSNNWLERTEEFLNIAFYVRDIMESGEVEEKRRLIITVGENFFLEDKKLTFQMRKPFDALLNPAYRTNVMPC